MIFEEKADICPKCNKKQLPKWTGRETARRCQNCGFIDLIPVLELYDDLEKKVRGE